MADKDVEGVGKKKPAESPAEPSKWSPENIKRFAGEVKNEFGKIAWPDKKHTMGSTVVVVVLVMLISFYLGAVDLLLGKIVSSFLG